MWGMGRDCIASLSEGLNGAIKKRVVGEHRWSAILREFIQQSESAFKSAVSEAEKLVGRGDFVVPLGRRYMNIDTELARRSFVVEKDDTVHKVYLEGVLLAEVTEDGGKYKCDCNYQNDVGLPCIHILAVDETAAFNREEVDAIWYTSTFLESFLGRMNGVGSQEEGGREEGKGEERGTSRGWRSKQDAHRFPQVTSAFRGGTEGNHETNNATKE